MFGNCEVENSRILSPSTVARFGRLSGKFPGLWQSRMRGHGPVSLYWVIIVERGKEDEGEGFKDSKIGVNRQCLYNT